MTEKYEFKDITVYFEDCIKGIYDKVERGSVDMAFCDPPFGINFVSRSDWTYRRAKGNRVDGYTEVKKDKYREFTEKWIDAVDYATKKNSTIYIVSGWTNLHHILDYAIESKGWFLMNHIIWWYSNPLPTLKKFRACHYHIVVFTKSKNVFVQNKHTFNLIDNRESPYLDIWQIPRDMRKKEYTPNATKLPYELVRRCVLTSSNEGELVLDCFVGNGTTPAVCLAYNRRFVGFEINLNTRKTIKYIVEKEYKLKEQRNNLMKYIFGE